MAKNSTKMLIRRAKRKSFIVREKVEEVLVLLRSVTWKNKLQPEDMEKIYKAQRILEGRE